MENEREKRRPSWPLGFIFLADLLFLLIAQVLVFALETSAEGDDESARVMGVYPLLDLHQPAGKDAGITSTHNK